MANFPPNCVAFITGAGSGIGLATAKRLAIDGVKKISLIDITSSHLEAAVTSLTSLGSEVEVLAIGADCSKEDDVERAVKETVEKFGRLDVCFNAAGIVGQLAKTEEMGVDNLESVLGVNLRGVWLCERAQIRQIMRQEQRDLVTGLPFKTRGSIVNVGSLASHLGMSSNAAYIMAKHGIRPTLYRAARNERWLTEQGVLGLVKADTIDYALEGIRINCVCPGWIKTGMTEFLYESPMSTALAARAAMNRWGLPEEIAFTASFLLSDRASFITGTSLDIDGGYRCQ